jgi:hypothetical protein
VCIERLEYAVCVFVGLGSLNTLCVVSVNSQVQARVDEAGTHHTDGVNFDLEDPAAPGSPLARAYTALVAETAAAFRQRFASAQVPGSSSAWPTPHGDWRLLL